MKVLVVRGFATRQKTYYIGKEYDMTNEEYEEFKFFVEKKSEDKAKIETKPIENKVVKGKKK